MVGEDTVESHQRSEAQTVLVPIRYPLRKEGIQTLRGASKLVADRPAASLVILHVNLLHTGHAITPADLQTAVENAVGPLTATYIVRNGYILEDEILSEADEQQADCIVVGTTHVPRRKWLIRRLLGPPLNLDLYIQRQSTPPVNVIKIDS